MLDFRVPLRPDHSTLQALDAAHEQGFRAFLSNIGHDKRSATHRNLASDALITLRGGLQGRELDPDYNDPYIAAAYMVSYHLSHCALSYWCFKTLFARLDVPDTLYVCDVGAGTGAGRVGLSLALNEHQNDVKVYFDAYEPSAEMLRAGNRFGEAFQGTGITKPIAGYRESHTGPAVLPELPDGTLRVVTAFHLSLPYNYSSPFRDRWPSKYRWPFGDSSPFDDGLPFDDLSPFSDSLPLDDNSPSIFNSAKESIQVALNQVSPDVGLFTCHLGKNDALKQAVGNFAGWCDKDRLIPIPNDKDGVSSRSSFYTNCAEYLGFTVPEYEPWPVRTWSRHRFRLPQGVLLLRASQGYEGLLQREHDRAAAIKRQMQIEAEERARKEQAEQEERERQRKIEAERLAAQRAEAERKRLEEERQRWDSLCVGQHLDGVVVGIAGFGAFVRVAESIDGLVHISELTRGWVNQVTDVVSVGQPVKVRVLSIDLEEERLSLSIKGALPDPWDDIGAFLPIGDVRTGKVLRIEGNKRLAFDIGDNLEGWIHVSHLGNRKLEDFHIGDTAQVVIHNIDPTNRRIWVRLTDSSPA